MELARPMGEDEGEVQQGGGEGAHKYAGYMSQQEE